MKTKWDEFWPSTGHRMPLPDLAKPENGIPNETPSNCTPRAADSSAEGFANPSAEGGQTGGAHPEGGQASPDTATVPEAVTEGLMRKLWASQASRRRLIAAMRSARNELFFARDAPIPSTGTPATRAYFILHNALINEEE